MKKLLMTASTWGHLRHFHLPYLRAFRELGWVVHIGCADVPDEIAAADETIALPLTKKMSAPQNFVVSRQLRAKIKREQYDLIVCHTSLAAFFTRLAVIGLKNRPKVINMVHGYLFDDDTPSLKKAIYLGAEKLTAPVTDVVLTMNSWDETYAREHRLGAKVQNVDGIGVNFSAYQPLAEKSVLRASLHIPQDAFVLIYPAEFSSRKNQQMLIRAMQFLPESVYLILAGRGDLLSDCHVLATELGLEQRVRFPGFVDDMPQWYYAADVAVSSSRSEGLPFNIMEALACGLPVVASDVKGHRDLVVSSEFGRLYPYNDVTAYVDAVTELMQDGQRATYSAQRKQAMMRYELSIVLDEVMSAYGVTAPAFEEK